MNARYKLIIILCFSFFYLKTATAIHHKHHRHKIHQKKIHKLHVEKKKIAHIAKLESLSKTRHITQKSFVFPPNEIINAQDKSSDNSEVALDVPFSQLNWPEISKKMYIKDNKFFVNYEDYLLKLTINPQLQLAAERFLAQSKILHGATVLIEPNSGKILALTQSPGKENIDFAVSSIAPAASLMKIITASTSIEQDQLEPEDKIHFHGSCGHLNNNSWLADPRKDTRILSFAQAFGTSCNPVFARLALKSGLNALKNYATKFMFNQPIPSDLKIQTSTFYTPDNTQATVKDIAKAGAGFGATKLNPIHAALLSATVRNRGIMMAPYIVEAAYNSEGKEIYRAQPSRIAQVILPSTSYNVEKLMLATIATGTSRHSFHKADTRAMVKSIGGKTGTLLDPSNKNILYTWFSGVAPLDGPYSIAISTVIASPKNWVVRASAIAQHTIAYYLNNLKGIE